MAEMIKPKKEDIVVLGRIVSASTEGVVANAELIYDGVSNMRQHEINKKFLSGRYTIDDSNIKDGSITHSKLARNSVQSDNIGAQAIESTHIRLLGILSQNLDYNSVVTEAIASKAVTSQKLGDESVLVSKIAQEVWDKIKAEYLRLEGGNMEGTIGWSGSNTVAIGKDGISVDDGDYNVYINASKADEGGCINISYEDSETWIRNSNIQLFSTDGTFGYSLILAESGISMSRESNDSNSDIFSINSDDDEGDVLVHGIGFATFDQDNIGLLSNDGTVGLALTDSEIDDAISEVWNPNGNVPDM